MPSSDMTQAFRLLRWLALLYPFLAWMPGLLRSFLPSPRLSRGADTARNSTVTNFLRISGNLLTNYRKYTQYAENWGSEKIFGSTRVQVSSFLQNSKMVA